MKDDGEVFAHKTIPLTQAMRNDGITSSDKIASVELIVGEFEDVRVRSPILNEFDESV